MKKFYALFALAMVFIAGYGQSYHPLASLPLAQNWDSANLITTNDNWSGVASIRGFLGQDITTGTAADPGSLRTVSTFANDLDVIANQRLTTITNGGVAEFDQITNPTVALQGSGTADAPHLVIYLNTTGVNNIRVQYNLRDIDATDNAIQPFALQYRVGNTGDFINLSAGHVGDATTGDGATLVTPVDVILPEAVNNQPQVQVRIITANASGNDEWVGIDDINISASKAVSIAAGGDATEGGVNGSFNVTFSPATTATTSFDYSFPDVATGTATFGTDYTVSLTVGGAGSAITASEGTITVPAATTSVVFTVMPVDDAAADGVEHIQLTITNPTEGYSTGNSSSSIDLTDNDAAPTVSVSAGTAVAEPATDGSFTITLSSPAPAGGVTVNYTLAGQATLNNDYTDAMSGTIAIAAGLSSANVVLKPSDDALVEGNETIIINLNSISGGYQITGSSATINLIDNDHPDIVINEIYGGGGNSGATFRNDYIELYNNSDVPVSLAGWSIQYASSSGSSWQKTDLSGTIPARGYYLIQQAAGTGGTAALPTPDAAGSIAMSATSGKVALVSNNILLSGACPVSAQIVDLVGFGTATCFEGSGTATAPSNTTSIQRSVIGADSDNNAADFSTSAPNPKNSVKDITPPAIASFSPADNATDAATAFTATLNFNEAIQKGTGNIYLKSADGTVQQTIDVQSALLSITGSSASFLIQGLAFQTGYYVEMDAGSFTDIEGNSFSGVIGNSTWNFTTRSMPVGSLGTTYDFATCNSGLADGFSFFSVTGAQVWSCTSFGRDAANMPLGSAPQGIQINGFSGTNIPNEDWLISPSYDLTGTTYPLLAFYSRTRFNGAPLQLKVSADYPGTGDPRNYTWTDINGKFPGQTTDVWTLSSDINLAAFKGSNVHFAFVYQSSEDDGARWTIDDITVINSATPPPPTVTVSATDIQFPYVPAGAAADKTFTLTANDLVAPVTLNATGDFLLSRDGASYQSSLAYSVAEANNIPQTVYVRFSPAVKNQNFTGTVVITTGDIRDTIFLKGTSIDPATTLEVVNWNVEWFGSTGFGPTNENQQEQNVKTILQNVNADVYALTEVVDEGRLAAVVSQLDGYSYVIGNFGSHVNPPDPTGGSVADAQKLAFVYKTSVFSNVTARPFINNQNTSSASYNNWSSGRYPFLMSADVTLNCVTKPVTFILVHAKANTSPTNVSYARRQAAAVELHDSLETYFAEANVIVLGDFNDDLDRTITDGINPPVSSYKVFTDDVADFFSPTLALSEADKKSTVSYNDVIDHVMITNDIQPYYMPGSATILTDAANLVNNYSSTTSDHYPVFTRYQFEQPAPPVVSNCPVVAPVCRTASGVYNIPVFDATSTCGAVSYSYVITGATERTGTSNDASGQFNEGSSVITWTATDGSGQTISCQTTVVINQKPVVTISDANAMGSGVIPNTVYLGYAPASSIMLQAAVDSAATPLNYIWSVAGESSASIIVNPIVATTYNVVVTDANGCSDTAYKLVDVMDVRAGKKLDKVVICHNGKSLQIGTAGVADHLAHGDMLGGCAEIITSNTGAGTDQQNFDGVINANLKVKVLSNPSVTQFTLITTSGSNKMLTLTVMDAAGRIVEKKTAAANGSIYLGNSYRPGIYYVMVMQGNSSIKISLIKQ
jgi:hypothetical protein